MKYEVGRFVFLWVSPGSFTSEPPIRLSLSLSRRHCHATKVLSPTESYFAIRIIELRAREVGAADPAPRPDKQHSRRIGEMMADLSHPLPRTTDVNPDLPFLKHMTPWIKVIVAVKKSSPQHHPVRSSPRPQVRSSEHPRPSWGTAPAPGTWDLDDRPPGSAARRPGTSRWRSPSSGTNASSLPAPQDLLQDLLGLTVKKLGCHLASALLSPNAIQPHALPPTPLQCMACENCSYKQHLQTSASLKFSFQLKIQANVHQPGALPHRSPEPSSFAG